MNHNLIMNEKTNEIKMSIINLNDILRLIIESKIAQI